MKHRFLQKILAVLVSCSMILSNLTVVEAGIVDIIGEAEIMDVSDEMQEMIEEYVEKEEGIAVDAQHFPDAQFRLYISKEMDVDHDGKLSKEERKISSLSVPSMEIEELTGIEYFADLKELDCSKSHSFF